MGKRVDGNLLGLGLIAFLFIFIALGGKINLGNNTLASISTPTYDGCQITEPVMGWVYCSPLAPKSEEKQAPIGTDKWFVLEYADYSGKYTFGLPTPSSPSTTTLRYSVVCDSTGCGLAIKPISFGWRVCGANTCTHWNFGIGPFSSESPVYGQTYNLDPLVYGEYIEFQGTGFEGSRVIVSASYTPYGLRTTEVLGGGLTDVSSGTSSCNLLNAPEGKKAIALPIPEGKFREPYTLNWNEYLNYKIGETFVTSSSIFNHPTLGDVFCYGEMAYPVSKQNFDDGSCMAYPSSSGTKVECCPQLDYCGTDFKLSPTPTCDTVEDCPPESGVGGSWMIDFSDDTATHLARYDCISSKCEIVERKTVECTTNGVCTDASKPVCDMNPNSDTAWTCIASIGPVITPPELPGTEVILTCDLTLASTFFWLGALVLFLGVFTAIWLKTSGTPGIIIALVVAFIVLFMYWQFGSSLQNLICTILANVQFS